LQLLFYLFLKIVLQALFYKERFFSERIKKESDLND
jgi:hypothetical protein